MLAFSGFCTIFARSFKINPNVKEITTDTPIIDFSILIKFNGKYLPTGSYFNPNVIQHTVLFT
jgi:hypothetical protein